MTIELKVKEALKDQETLHLASKLAGSEELEVITEVVTEEVVDVYSVVDEEEFEAITVKEIIETALKAATLEKIEEELLLENENVTFENEDANYYYFSIEDEFFTGVARVEKGYDSLAVEFKEEGSATYRGNGIITLD